MKIKSIFAAWLTIAVLLAGCSDNSDNPTPAVDPGFETAYLSLRVTYPILTRAGGSTEDGVATTEESKINSLYVITFDKDQKLVHHPKENPVIVIAGGDLKPGTGVSSSDAIRVSPSTKYLLLVANPGAVLTTRINLLTSGASYTDFNKVVSLSIATGDSRDDLANEIRQIDGTTAKNFAMINTGLYDDVTDEWNADCLIDVSDNIVEVNATTSESAAKEAAEATNKRAKIQIERLSAKMVVSVAGEEVLKVVDNAHFVFKGWALDYRNSTFYPFATKKNINATHTGSVYGNNFYTEDPNFTETNDDKGYAIGIILNELDSDKTPIATWNAVDVADYCIENTMAKEDQRYGAATRVVIKAEYTPEGYTEGSDWFSFGSQTYETLDLLQTAYSTAKKEDLEAPLVKACDNFFTAVEAANENIDATDFLKLTQEELDDITNGGEITKIENCIRWYQKSLCYYTYIIRHDNTNNDKMGYGKYGVVRNNWYSLRLTKVNGKGTPWYPGDGPGDPKPEDPIDEDAAFLAFDITVAPWIYWTTDFEI